MKQTVLDKMATLSALWESYAQLIRRRNDKNVEQKLQQRRFVLDKFLSQFLQVSIEDKGNICIGEMRNISNELSQEFMRNVDMITRHLNDDDANTAIGEYMLRGRGWRLLYTIDRVGIKGICQRQDLCLVLLQLLPFCTDMQPSCPAEAETSASTSMDAVTDLIEETYNKSTVLGSCFQAVNKLSKLKPLGIFNLQARKLRPSETSQVPLSTVNTYGDLRMKRSQSGLIARDTKSSRKRLKRSTPSKRQLDMSNSDSEEEVRAPASLNEGISFQSRYDDRRSRTPRFKRGGLRTHMWSPAMKDEESDTDDEYAGNLWYVEECPMTISSYHLVRILLKLLQNLGELDISQTNPSRALASTVLPHLIYFVKRFRQPRHREELSSISKAEKWLDLQQPATNNRVQELSRDAAADEELQELTGQRKSTQSAADDEDLVPWNGTMRATLLRQAIRALLTLSGIVATQQGGVRILNNLKVVETLLDLNLLDSLIPSVDCYSQSSYLPTTGPHLNSPLDSTTILEANVAIEMVCGTMQLLQAIYSNLSFNPSFINDANTIASKAMKFEVVLRMRRLMAFTEVFTNQSEKNPAPSEQLEQELLSSVDSSATSKSKKAETEPFDRGSQNELESCMKKSESDLIGESTQGSTGKSQEDNKSSGLIESGIFTSSSTSGVEKPERDQEIKEETHEKEFSNMLPSLKSAQPTLCTDSSSDLVRCIGALITTLKGVKINYIHAIKCLKRRHRNCEYSSYYDHHHDILGSPHFASGKDESFDQEDADVEQSLSNSQGHPDDTGSKKSFSEPSTPLKCVVAELAVILLDSIAEARFKAGQIQLLSTIRLVGVCCCLQPERVISAIVPLLPLFSPAVRSYALDTLTFILLEQFQGAEEKPSPCSQNLKQSASSTAAGTTGWDKTKEGSSSELHPMMNGDSSRCVYCYLDGSSPLLAGLPTAMDSGFSSCDIEEIRRQKLLERWKALRMLRNIVISKDENIALTCAKHLMTLAVRGNSEIKEELFFGVYLHVLHMKVQLPGHMSEPSKTPTDHTVPSMDKPQPLMKENKGEGVTETAVFDAGHNSVPEPARFGAGANSRDSLTDSFPTTGGLSTPADISSAEDGITEGAVPSSIMLLCVSALPYVLQVDKVMSMFLARGGLAKLNNLLEYEQLRRPVMSVFEALVMIDERRLRGKNPSHLSAYEGGGVMQTFIDTLAKRTCTVTATLQQMSLQSAKAVPSESERMKQRRQRASSPDPTEDTEVKTPLAHVSSMYLQDVERAFVASVQDEDALHNMMAETLPVLLDMWKTCAKLCMNSRMFRNCYRASPCLCVVQETLVLALSLLGEISDPSQQQQSSTGDKTPSETSRLNSVSEMPGSYSESFLKPDAGRQYCRATSVEAGLEDDDDEQGSSLFQHQAKLEFIEAVMMVCFSCHTIGSSQKRGHEQELWLRLNEALQSCIHLEAFKLSAVFQMLLNVALPRCPSILEYSYSQVVSMLNLREREDIADEDEVRRLLQQGLDEDGDALITEHGYEADTECTICFDWKKGLEYNVEQQQNIAMNECGSGCSCFPAVFRLFVELMVACHRKASRGVILHTVALRLMQILRTSRRSVRAVVSEGLLSVLINGFREVLTTAPATGKQSTLQEIILSLIQVIAQAQISAAELRLFLRLFQDNTETTNSLLSTLLAVIEKSPVSPTTSAVFPVKLLQSIEPILRGEDSDENSESTSERASWNHAAIEFEVPSIQWPPCPKGFSLAFWLCTDQHQCRFSQSKPKGTDRNSHSDTENTDKKSTLSRPPTNECLLMVAIGNKEKMLETWVHPKSSSLIIRLTSGVSQVTVLRELCLDHFFSPSQWHQLAIKYVDVLDGSTFVGKLTLILDGWFKKEFILDHPASFSKLESKQGPFLCVGDAKTGTLKFHNTGTWRMGTLRLFSSVQLSDEFWFHLYCLGPDCAGLAKCDGGDLHASYTPAMQKHMVNVTHLNWDVLVGVQQVPDMDKARDCQVVVYKVSQPEVYSIFVIPQAVPQTKNDDLGLVPASGSPSDRLTQKPMLMIARMRGRVKLRETATLEKAVEQAGGVKAFLFLVAKVFEDSMKAVQAGTSTLEQAEQLQSKATHILLQLIHQFPSLAQTFEDASGYAMLAKIFTSSKSIVGFKLLKVIVDASTTDTVFKSSPSGPNPILRSHPEGVIRDVEILTQLLLNWRIWNKGKEEVTALLFGALELLVSEKHPHRSFNLKQMQAGGVINKIFNIYLERIQDGQPSLSPTISKSAANVIKNLLGSPPDLHLLMAVMDFMLLVHPAPSGFINSTPGSFYFKLWWDGVRPKSSSISSKSSAPKPRRVVSEMMVSHKDTSGQDETDSSSFRDQETMTYPSSPESQDNDEVFEYPPLKASRSNLGQTADRDADHEESDVAWKTAEIRPILPQGRKGIKDESRIEESFQMTSSDSAGAGDGLKKKEPQKQGKDLVDSEDKGIVIESTPDTEEKEVESEGSKTRSVSIEGNKHPSPRRMLSYQTSQTSQDQGQEKVMLRKKKGKEEEFAVGDDDDEYGDDEEEDESREKSDPSLGEKSSTTTGELISEGVEETEKGLILLCVSLLEYLCQIVLEFSESSLDSVFSKVVSPKSLLVLAKNPSSDMRLAVMKLLGAYLSRAPTSLIDAFIKVDGFYLLANQLRNFSVNRKHIEAATSILVKQDFRFDENFMLGDIGELSPVQQVAPILLLSLVDGTATDPQLCRDTLNLLSQLLDATPTMSSLLLDLGLAETMCNLATNIQRRTTNGSADEEEVTRSLLVDVQHVLCTTAVSEFSWLGPTHFQNVEDMFTLLKALEDNEFSQNSDTGKKRADTARAFQISLVVKILEYVEKRSEELSQSSSSGWFTSSTSTASPTSPPPSKQKGLNFSSTSSFSNPSALITTSTSPRIALSGGSVSIPKHKAMLPGTQHLYSKETLLRRSPFSSPDMMGYLAADPSSTQEDQAYLDSDSSTNSSRRLMSPSRKQSESSATSSFSRSSRLSSFFNRRKKMVYTTVNQSELLERFKKVLVIASDLAVMFPRDEMMRPVESRTLNFIDQPKTPTLEDRYLKHLFVSVYRFYEHSLNKEGYSRKNRNPIMHGARDVLRTQFTRLLLCMMSLKLDFDMRLYALAFILPEPNGTDAVRAIISDKQVGQELSFYLYNLLASWKDWLNPAQRELGFSLMQILRRAGFTFFSPDNMPTQAQVNALVEEKRLIDARYRREFTQWLQKREEGTARIIQKFEPVLRRVTDQAMSVTQDVTRLQIEERKKLVSHIKRAMTTQIQLKKQWQELVQNLTHDRAVWYTPSSYPKSWQLDPTEGPGRVRKRLQRCHLNIEKRFLLQEHQDKLDAEHVDPPLIFLFEDDHQMSDSAALIYRLYTNEKIQHTCRCTAISPASESKGEILVGEVCIFFVADGAISGASYTQLLLGNLDELSITWPHTDIRELHKRWYQLQDVGLEIFLISGGTCLLAFQSTQDRDNLYSILSSLELPNLIAGETLPSVQKAWLEGEVTNYDYLMHLNKLAGRSYTDLMQYPVFPFVLKDYNSGTLNLNDPNAFRDLKKPIAIQDKSRERKYKDNYEFLCQEAARPNSEAEMMMRVAPFHYGSHYSNSGTVLHYMVRLPPFTRMFLSYQDSNFDIPDRTFHSLGTSWRLSSYQSSTDVKELIPEFFFLPEFLVNGEGFDFGLRQNGEQVHHVHLPPWCGGDPRLFILIHRQALESEFVTSHLNSWLDLVFGYKQQGEEAVRAINVFHPSTYFGVDASGIKDPLKRQALLTMIRTYGQTPKQLFKTIHPKCQLRLPMVESYVRRPVPDVVGLRWGQYVGSPELPPPVPHILADLSPSVIAKLVPLPTGLVFGVETNSSIILLHGKQRDMAVRSTDVMWAGVVSWGYHDNLIRIRSYRDKPLVNFLPHHSFGKITCVESVPDCRLLFTAGNAGVIYVHSMTHNSSKPSNLQVRGIKKTLYGHSGPITSLYVCQAFSILVSGSSDGTCIIWDLNRLSYVRSITSHSSEILALTVSETLGDIASASRISRNMCILQLHTVNATHIASQEVEHDVINCLAYSCAPEGKSVNVVAGGMESGTVRLWSSWDLTPIRDLEISSPIPIISLTFTSDSQYLLSALADGKVMIWSREEKLARRQLEKFIPVTNFGDSDK